MESVSCRGCESGEFQENKRELSSEGCEETPPTLKSISVT